MRAEDIPDLRRRWFPVCSRSDLPAGHIFETGLLGDELAVWQGRGELPNVWENRCPHRGMRLTLGVNLGAELRCAYHGYRFADGSAMCTSVPAQPERAPPRSLCIRSYPVRESGNLIWTCLAEDESESELPLAGAVDGLVLYSVAVNAAAATVGAGMGAYRFRPADRLGKPIMDDESCMATPVDAYSFHCIARAGELTAEVRLFLQPVDATCTVLHGVLLGANNTSSRMAALRHHAEQFSRLREECERLSGAASS